MGLFDFFRKKKVQDNATANLTDKKVKAGNIEVTVQMGAHTPSDNDIVPAEKRIKAAFPSRNNGLYPHEILVLDYANTFYTQGNNYQRFWWTRYGVKNIDAILHSLLYRGFIAVGPITATLEKKTVADLKAVLESHKLNSKGKKAILIQRIIHEVPADELDKLFPDRLYMRTEKGEAELEAEEYVSYIHRHTIENLDIWSLNKLVYSSPSNLPYRDVIWRYLNQNIFQPITLAFIGIVGIAWQPF